ncbi:uncharacterized protein TRAVEDRAFT_54680 [Trametes versicolor FP-101664 SS1]|uniref:Uncharacterized protein n=1 Tax=Trametes versicolor (strain FP-101664) TaxID=717944 RepID=R7S683_TRAVS|nr:uncharacterized protein TRAVEDRAFT_54680 [Trametes versicolor FP-101664 SS1]EIW51301.1 hypothetical protein TRAVEDRAFT_54680 [Trametes versicolor FP-101664 SS1]
MDESGVEVVTSGAIDPLTKNEDGRAVGGTGVVMRPETRKVLVTHAPLYWPDEMKAHLAELDVYVEEYRIENDKKTKGGVHLPWCCGEDRQDSELPSLQGATINCLLMPRCMICPEWLASEKGKKQDDNDPDMDMEAQEGRCAARRKRAGAAAR